MGEKLTWQEIQELYDQEWVELIDYEWDETVPYPEAGIVRSHSKTRKGLSQQVRTNPVDDSAIVFVGDWKLPPNTTVNFNLHRVTMTPNQQND